MARRTMKRRVAVGGMILAIGLSTVACASDADSPVGNPALTVSEASGSVTMTGNCAVLNADEVSELIGESQVVEASETTDGCEWSGRNGAASYSIRSSSSAPMQAGGQELAVPSGKLLVNAATTPDLDCLGVLVPEDAEGGGESVDIVVMPAAESGVGEPSATASPTSVCQRFIPIFEKLLHNTGLTP